MNRFKLSWNAHRRLANKYNHDTKHPNGTGLYLYHCAVLEEMFKKQRKLTLSEKKPIYKGAIQQGYFYGDKGK